MLEGTPGYLTTYKRLNGWSSTGELDHLLQGLIGSLEEDLGGLLSGQVEANRALSDADVRLLLSLLSPSALGTFVWLNSRHVPMLWTVGVRMALQRVQETQTTVLPGTSESWACIPIRFPSRYVK